MIRFELIENGRMALTTLLEHKMRSFLTVLGVVIGITALISVASILVGMDRDMRAYLNDYGTDTIFMFRFNMGVRIGRLSAEERMRKPLTLEDALAIQETCPSVKSVTAEVFPRFGMGRRNLPSVRYREHEVFNISYTGTLPAYEDVYNARLNKGRFITEADDLHRSDVVVLGYDLADALFPAEDPIGKTVLVTSTSYEVIGVLEKRKGQFLRDDTADREVIVPYRSYRKHNPSDDEHFLGARAYPGKKAEAEDEIRALLRRRRNVPYSKPDNFGMSSSEQIAE